MDHLFLPGVDAEWVKRRLAAAGGNELGSGKLAHPESSAALAVNTFGWFIHRPDLLPPFPGLSGVGTPTRVDVEYCARFPWAGGRHPWLDAAVFTPTHLIGVESKRFEPFRDRKTVSLPSAYDRPVWGNEMQPFERLRDALRSGELKFEYLDAAQLIKHAFGLVTDARRHRLRPALVYLYAEPLQLAGKPIPRAYLEEHRAEVQRFAAAVADAEVRFSACAYREWLSQWASPAELSEHAAALVETFNL
jgi:hypothetical protein